MRVRAAKDGSNAWVWCWAFGHRPALAVQRGRIVQACTRCGTVLDEGH